MESSKGDDEEDSQFFDAPDDLPLHNCVSTDRLDASTSHVPFTEPFISPEISSTATYIRRRSLSRRGISRKESQYSSADPSSIESNITQVSDSKTSSRERRQELYRDSKENEKDVETTDSNGPQVSSVRVASSVGEAKNEESTVTTAGDGQVGDSVDSVAELGGGTRLTRWRNSVILLRRICLLVIKAIVFQFNLFISLITFPLWMLYCCCLFVIDPFRTMRRGGVYVMAKLINLWNLIFGSVSPLIYERLKEHKPIWKLALQFGWGLFWAIYVCFILCGLLVSSLVVGGFMMSYLVEEPIVIKDSLNFDYTKNSPVAYVQVLSCDGVGCDVNCKDSFEVGKRFDSRVIQPNHNLQVTVSLTLPESEYNRNLGMFQVRVDFLSANGQTFASSRHPCVLKFKSEPIRLLPTFLKIAPLVAGYVSESQTLELKIEGFTEGYVPTACLKVIMEQRAEFRPGSGIPEVYDASVIPESELPLFKRIIWCWKKTLYIWISMMLFIMEFLFTLVCCRPLVIPRTRQRDRSASNNSNQKSLQERR